MLLPCKSFWFCVFKMLPVHCPAHLSESIESSLVAELNHTKDHDVQQKASYSS